MLNLSVVIPTEEPRSLRFAAEGSWQSRSVTGIDRLADRKQNFSVVIPNPRSLRGGICFFCHSLRKLINRQLNIA